MDHDRRPGALHECGGNAGSKQIAAPVVDSLGDQAVDVPLLEDVPADQSTGAGDQGDGGHSGASRSRAEIAVTGSGQPIPTVGSSKRRLRALSAT